MKSRSTRGQLHSFIALLIAGIILFLALTFSSTFRLLVLGVGLIILSFFLISDKNPIQSKNIKTTLFLIFLGIGLVMIVSTNVVQQINPSSNSFVSIPAFATLSCESSGTTNTVQTTVPQNGEWISRSLPKNTNSWTINMRTPDEGLFSVENKYIEYYLCTRESFDACYTHEVKQVSGRGSTNLIGSNIPSTHHVWVQYQSRGLFSSSGRSGSFTNTNYDSFRLVVNDPFRGGRQTIETLGCQIPSNSLYWQKRITNFQGSSQVSIAPQSSPLSPGQFFNYVTTNVLSETRGNTQQGGYCIYENGNARVYEIERITTGDGSNYNRVNTNRLITTAQCCQNQALPNGQICRDGIIVNIQGNQCTTNQDCGSLEYNPVQGDPTKVQRAVCLQNQCTFQQRDVECTSSAQCSSNQICSRNSFTCVDAGVGGEGIPRGSDEDSVCGFGQQLVSRSETKGRGIFGIGALIGLTEEVVIDECRLSPWVSTVTISSVILLLGIIALNMNKPKRRRK